MYTIVGQSTGLIAAVNVLCLSPEKNKTWSPVGFVFAFSRIRDQYIYIILRFKSFLANGTAALQGDN